MPRGGNPLMKNPCPECEQIKRHAPNCGRKRKSSPRGVSSEKFVTYVTEKIKELPDGAFAAVLRACLNESVERRERIEREAAERLRELDEVMPKSPPSVVQPIQAVRGDIKPTPMGQQCTAICPEATAIKCTQPMGHEGQHYNHTHKRSWQRKIA